MVSRLPDILDVCIWLAGLLLGTSWIAVWLSTEYAPGVAMVTGVCMCTAVAGMFFFLSVIRVLHRNAEADGTRAEVAQNPYATIEDACEEAIEEGESN